MKKIILLLTSLLATTQLMSVSFDCDKARSSIELQICQSDTLSILDSQVAGTYGTLRETPKNFYFINELYHDQKAWQKMRDRECGSLSNAKLKTCLVDVYEQRLQALDLLQIQSSASVSIMDHGVCSSVPIKEKIIVDNDQDICNTYTYLDNNSRIKLTNDVLVSSGKNSTASAILKIVDEKNVITSNHCDAYKNRGIYQESVVYINQNVISFQYFAWEYTGGAHGNGDNYYVNYDRNSGELITWKTLFKNNKKFKNYLQKRVKNELLVQGFISKEYEAKVIASFENVGYFSIRHNGLYIEYDSYELAPYSSGYPSLLVSKKVLKKYMSKKQYRDYFRNDGSVYLNLSCQNK